MMRARRRTIAAIAATALLALALPLAAPVAVAQGAQHRADDGAADAGRAAPAMLIADKLSVRGRTRLVAEGHVEVVQGDTRLHAARIVYDRTDETLQIDGPITLSEGGTTRILAESGELERDLQRGLLRGARMVFDSRVQLAANRIDRVGGRYTQLYKVAATSCRICNRDEPPLWQIRARRVIHDAEAGQLYFEQAQLRVLDMPVLWLPRLRMPDPTQTRATGFLMPSVHQTTQLGFGVRVPYFIRLGDHRDLTLTPYVAAETNTLEWRYRQAFRRGRITFSGSVSDDTLPVSGLRGHIFGEGRFELANDFRLDFGVEVVSDQPYLLEYDYSDKDRLRSGVELSRVRRDAFVRAEVEHFKSLRPGESNATLPTMIAGARYERRLFPAAIGGELRLSAEASAQRRTSSATADADGDGTGDGLDVARAGVTADWRRNWTLAGGLRAGLVTGVAVDAFDIAQDPATAGTHTQATPHAAVTLRWPLAKTNAAGVTHVVEPVAMLGWTGGNRVGVPNDESTRVEFDEGNLMSLSRFPAPDRRQRGHAAAIGVNWSRTGPTGWQGDLTLGQVFFDDRDPAFTPSSGLSGRESDMLVAGRVDTPGGLELAARGLLDPDALSLSKAEARARWHTDALSLGSSVVWLRQDAAEDRLDDRSEWAFDGAYRLSRHWTGRADWRYDLANDEAARAGVALEYRNECVALGLSVSRRFASSALVAPSTNFGFTVGLSGFSASANGDSYARTCRE